MEEDFREYQGQYNKEKTYPVIHPWTDMVDYLSWGPIFIVSGDKEFVTDSQGKVYFNGIGSLWNLCLGHGNTRVIQAIIEQLNTLAYINPIYNSNLPSCRLANKLLQLVGDDFSHVYFGMNGSDAVESAIKIIRQIYWKTEKEGKIKIAYLQGAYHGNGFGALSVTDNDSDREPFYPLLEGFYKVPAPYCYRCPYGLSEETCALRCVDGIEARFVEEGSDETVALIIEPFQGVGGARITPPGYLKKVSEICKKHEVFLIVDEVSTGFGRTGTMFAVEHDDITPDIYIFSKGLTGGYLPLSAIVLSKKVYEKAFNKELGKNAFHHGYTASGHPVCCAAALATINCIEEDQLVQNSALVGRYMLDLLRKKLSGYPIVGDIRGKGLMLAIELVQDKASKKQLNKEQMRMVSATCISQGLLLYFGDSLIGLNPPLTLTPQSVDLFCGTFEKVIKGLSKLLV